MELSGLRIGALEHMLPESERYRLMEYVKLYQMRQKADDHTRCPMCHEQLYFCDCIAWEASEILEMLIGIILASGDTTV